MILCTRVEARDFRALFARCLAGRPRGPASPLVIRFANGTRVIASTTVEGVMLTHTSPATGERDELLVLPGSILAGVEGSTDEGVKLDRQSKLRAVLHWQGGGKPRTLSVELILTGTQHELPATPTFSPLSPKLLLALHECGRTTAREPGRFALTRIQVQGRAGRVVGTDGKIALVCKGFKFPFTESVLVPAVPVFGSKPLTRVPEVSVDRTSTHLVIAVGPWAVWLPIDTTGRYPDVAALIPRQPLTTAAIDHTDATELLKVLHGLPGQDEENRPVTLDAGGSVTIRGRGENTDNTREITLARSTASGPTLQVALDRRVLARALSLGCRELRLTPDKPFVAQGDGFTFIAAPLDPDLIVPPTADARRISTETAMTRAEQPTPTTQRRNEMPPTDPNGHTPTRGDPPDPLLVAEELRDSLAEAATKAARLVAILKAGRKEKKVLTSIFANLKQLGLDSGGPQQ